MSSDHLSSYSFQLIFCYFTAAAFVYLRGSDMGNLRRLAALMKLHVFTLLLSSSYSLISVSMKSVLSVNMTAVVISRMLLTTKSFVPRHRTRTSPRRRRCMMTSVWKCWTMRSKATISAYSPMGKPVLESPILWWARVSRERKASFHRWEF